MLNIDKQYPYDILVLNIQQGGVLGDGERGELENENGREGWTMKKIPLLIFSLFVGILTGCGPTVRSSGLLVEHIKKYGDVEIRYPKRVLVLSDGNVEPITNRATKIFSEGLGKMGFDVVDPKPVYAEFDINDLTLAMYTEIGSEEIKNKSEEIRKSLADKFRVEGVFTSHVHSLYFSKKPVSFDPKGLIQPPSGWPVVGEPTPSGLEEMGGRTWFTNLTVFLYQIPKGNTLWRCDTVKEHFFKSTWEVSIEMTTKKVLRRLERDIEKMK